MQHKPLCEASQTAASADGRLGLRCAVLTLDAAHPEPLGQGVLRSWSRFVTAVILPGQRPPTMPTTTEDEMRTALRQAGAIAAVDGQHSIRRRLGVAHRLYDAMLLLNPHDRARRIRLIDSIFTQPRRGPDQGFRNR